MVLIIGIIVTILIFIILGYRVDINNGRVERSALLQFKSDPSGAMVLVDGVDTGIKTADKYAIVEGVHSFQVKKDGYEIWQKTLDIKAGTLTWLNYIRLIPTSRPIDAVSNFKSLKATLPSLNGDKMAIQQDDTKPVFQVANLKSDGVQVSDINLSTDLYTKADGKHTFLVYQWDESGRYLLIKHSFSKTQYEWLTVDTQDVAKSKNVTKLLDIAIETPVFSGTSGNIIYALSDGDIRKLDLAAGTISRSLVANVRSFKLFGTNVITYIGFTQASKPKQVVGLYRDGDSSPHVLRTVDSATTSLNVATAKYFNDDYLAISEGNKVDILSGEYPASGSKDSSSLSLFDSFTLDADITNLSFSPEGFYVLAQSGMNFVGYDIEHEAANKFSVAGDKKSTISLEWLDENHLWSSYGDKLTMYDFDGTNLIVVNKMLYGQKMTLSTDEKYVYSIDKTTSGYQLQRVKIIL